MTRPFFQQGILPAALAFLLLLLARCCHGIPVMNEAIQTDRLAQHIVSHWHFDHLEPLATSRYNELASKLIQDHLEIRTRLVGGDEDDGSEDNDEVVDAAMLEAQVLEGVYSHIQGILLPSMWWDSIAEPLLSQTVLVALVRNAMEEHCPGEIVPASCLLNHASHLIKVIDAGITTQLDLALAKLDTQVAPDALAQTFALLQRLNLDVSIKQPWVSGQWQQGANLQCGDAHAFTRYLDLARVQ